MVHLLAFWKGLPIAVQDNCVGWIDEIQQIIHCVPVQLWAIVLVKLRVFPVSNPYRTSYTKA